MNDFDIDKFNWNGKTILVAEDEEMNFFYLKELLEPTNAIIVHAENGQKAIDYVLSQPVDLVLMDIRLPVIDGYECTRQIKQIKPGLPIIAQTAFAMTSDVEKSRKAGCDAHLSKPIETEELVELIHSFLYYKG